MERKSHDSRFLPVLLVFSAVALIVVYFALKANPANPASSGHELIASVAGYNLGTSGLEPAVRKKLLQLDSSRYEMLSLQAETWIENSIVEREAKARGVTPEALVIEALGPIKATDEEVRARYLQDPSFDSLPYGDAVKQIRLKLLQESYEAKKRGYIKTLYPKYRARLYLKAPEGHQPAAAVRTAMGPFPAKDDVAGGSVVGAPFKGKRDAPVVLEIYSDFMCPFSGRFHQTMHQLQDAFADKLRVEYHHFPLDFHQGAALMSEASVCAQEQGKFWEFHDALYTDQKANTPQALTGIAQKTGLDQAKFDACLSSGKYRQWVKDDQAGGAQRGVGGTPGFFLNGRLSSGAMPFENVKAMVEWQLDPKGAYPGRPSAPPPRPKGGAPAPQAPGGPSEQQTFTQSDLKDAPSIGPDNAPITLIEFVDSGCGFCHVAFPAIQKIAEEYEGRLRLVSMQFPISPSTELAAQAAGCAYEKGQYWKFREQVFSQGKFDSSMESILAAGEKAGVARDAMKECLDAGRYKSWVAAQSKTGGDKGVKGTPTYFINGRKVEGARPFEEFKRIVDEKLAGKG